METLSGLLLIAVILAACCAMAVLLLTLIVAAVLWKMLRTDALHCHVTSTAGTSAAQCAHVVAVTTQPKKQERAAGPAKRKTVKCAKCAKFTDLGTPVREVLSDAGSHFVYACQRCGAEINQP